ncbi:zinc finger protein 385D isoform X2 [Electrophorus electricus]|uniref:zinc finger protein 385D isoform X2 n=1 Tax=Electrophorus electricus TaxID=8005 RepID=UPI0015D0149F|nr:zinc finger protein 385D isoform X2 [Electrophorus electricus]
MENSMFLGNACPSGSVPAVVRAPLPPVQSSLGLKQFLPFPLDVSSTLNLLPRFNSMDPVQKAVLHHTLGIPVSSKKKHVSCTVCQLRFNSQSQALSHYKGTKHAKKLKSLDTPKSKAKSSVVAKETTSKWPGSAARDATTAKEPPKSLRPTAPPQPGTDREEDSPHVLLHPTSPPLAPQILVEAESTSAAAASEQGSGLAPGAPQPAEQDTETDPEAETEEEKALRLLYCSLCKVAVNSPSQLEAHNSGTKHKTMLEARNGNGSIKSFPRPGVKSKLTTSTAAATGLQNKTFHCETCDVHVNSETQLKQHISSRRHKDRAAGKPAKPKYSPYAKTQRGQTKQQTLKVPLSKDLCQPLQATLVPSHLAAVATAAAVGPTFPLRASHSPSLFQTQPLPTALLRAAPGPIRTTHAPVLFAPY